MIFFNYTILNVQKGLELATFYMDIAKNDSSSHPNYHKLATILILLLNRFLSGMVTIASL